MARIIYLLLLLLFPGIIAGIYFMWTPILWGLLIWVPYALIGGFDLFSRHNILRNYPFIGHLRYILEAIRPEIRQYFISDDLEERPFSREQRSLIYQRAKGTSDAHPFGTQQLISAEGYVYAQHSLLARKVDVAEARIMFGGPDCQQPYHASRLNISAMSFGALSANALRALNRGARHGDFAHNTGEGGLSPYHLQEGGDLIWQIGTGYFGCRTPEGLFCAEAFAAKAQHAAVKMIEIKLSQGAKPAHGGILPAAKVSAEIAKIRGVKVGEDCISPPLHSAFSTPLELMLFVKQLRQLSGGKPIGFKLCVGRRHEFMALCKAMVASKITPDFITVDGAEGGTGAAPIEFSNRLGTPLHEALLFVHHSLLGCGLRYHMRLIASGKITSGFDMVRALGMGADTCNMARPMLFSLGCIQACRCHTNQCPTGITTQNKWRGRAVVVKDKYLRVSRYHQATINSFLQLCGAMGCDSVAELDASQLYRRDANGASYAIADEMPSVVEGSFLHGAVVEPFRDDWYAASEHSFALQGKQAAASDRGDAKQDKQCLAEQAVYQDY